MAAESPPSAVQVHAAARCRAQWRIRRDRRNGPCRLLHRRGRPGLQRVTLRCVAQPTETAPPPCVQVHTKAMGGTVWEARAVRGGGEAGAPHAASDPPAPGLVRFPPRAPCADGCASGARRRRSPLQREGGNRLHSTRTVTGARAARLVVHRCTRGSKCRAHRGANCCCCPRQRKVRSCM
jgi:hypothetical protein